MGFAGCLRALREDFSPFTGKAGSSRPLPSPVGGSEGLVASTESGPSGAEAARPTDGGCGAGQVQGAPSVAQATATTAKRGTLRATPTTVGAAGSHQGRGSRLSSSSASAGPSFQGPFATKIGTPLRQCKTTRSQTQVRPYPDFDFYTGPRHLPNSTCFNRQGVHISGGQSSSTWCLSATGSGPRRWRPLRRPVLGSLPFRSTWVGLTHTTPRSKCCWSWHRRAGQPLTRRSYTNLFRYYRSKSYRTLNYNASTLSRPTRLARRKFHALSLRYGMNSARRVSI